MIATFASSVPPTVAWLKSFGVKFDFLPTYFITACQPRMAPIGGGLALVEALASWCEKNGGQFFYETTARALIQDERGARDRRALRRRRPHGDRPARAFASSLASGGFEGNPEMLTHYLGPRARYIRPVARGGYYNKGEGIRMALAAGAAACGDYGSFHAEPLDPRSGATEPVVLVFNYGILVNKTGARFVNEAPATVDADLRSDHARSFSSSRTASPIASSMRNSTTCRTGKRSVRSDQPPISAATLPELASKLGIDARANSSPRSTPIMPPARPARSSRSNSMASPPRQVTRRRSRTGRGASTSRHSSPSRSSAATVSPSAGLKVDSDARGHQRRWRGDPGSVCRRRNHAASTMAPTRARRRCCAARCSDASPMPGTTAPERKQRHA